MRWRLLMVLAVLAAASVAAVIVAIASVSGPGDLERIKSAMQLQTGCADIVVNRPSHAPLVTRWATLTAQTADVMCRGTGPRVVYARFHDGDRLRLVVSATPPSSRYCLFGASILVDPVAAASTVFGDMCQSLGGRLVTGSGA